MNTIVRFITALLMLSLTMPSGLAQIQRGQNTAAVETEYPARRLALESSDPSLLPKAVLPSISVTPLNSSAYTVTTLVQNVLISGCSGSFTHLTAKPVFLL